MMCIMCLNRMKGFLATATCGCLPEKVRLQRIAVRPDSPRYGVGRKMMDAMVEYAVREGACAMSLEVREGKLGSQESV